MNKQQAIETLRAANIPDEVIAALEAMTAPQVTINVFSGNVSGYNVGIASTGIVGHVDAPRTVVHSAQAAQRAEYEIVRPAALPEPKPRHPQYEEWATRLSKCTDYAVRQNLRNGDKYTLERVIRVSGLNAEQIMEALA